MEHSVKGCIDCPMFENYDNFTGSYCHHPGAPFDPDLECAWVDKEDNPDYGPPKGDEHWPEMYLPITPDWCPLLKESITITLIKNGE